MVGKMFNDPDMKKVMRSQQSMAISMMYGDLAKELGLAPDDAKQVMDIITERQMAMAEKGCKCLARADRWSIDRRRRQGSSGGQGTI
jgi:hypothetical protein